MKLVAVLVFVAISVAAPMLVAATAALLVFIGGVLWLVEKVTSLRL